ncbi:hypothetical protein ABKA04_004153 [Annulohypoxylon sp. FPYF3050]
MYNPGCPVWVEPPIWPGPTNQPTNQPPPQPPQPTNQPIYYPPAVKKDATAGPVINTNPNAANPFESKPSDAGQEWDSRKSLDNESHYILDELMQYQGLEAVKQQFLDIKSKVDCCRVQGRDLKSERFNIVFQGNPGTATSGPDKIKKKIKKILTTHNGGVLFVDEAYQLTASYANSGGRAAIDIMLTAMENNIGKLVVIFVGYKDEMESFFEHNPGLYSRIPYTMNFADFTDGELWKILSDNISKQYGGTMQVEDGMNGLYMRIAIRRLAQTRGSRNFGNARAVQNLLAQISERQAQRLRRERRSNLQPNYFLFTKEDLIGPDPSTAAKKSEAWAKLQELIGLHQVKDSVQSMIRMMDLNYRRELPKLYGQIMAELGYLSHGDVVLKNPADFIGDCLGKSETNTKNILEATVGKVLVIDEAYMLDTGDPSKEQDKYKTGVIDTIVAMVQGVPGEDRCIVLIGYENQIKNMFHNVNPGLSRRFPIERPFRFENFDLPQLEQILRLKMKAQELECTDDAIKVAREVLERSLMRPNFSNAGEVDSLLSAVKMNYETRLSKLPPGYMDVDMKVEAEDFDPNHNRKSRVDCRKLIGGLVHSTITDKFIGYQKRYSRAKSLGINPRDQVPTRFIFKGHPGTGKTTTAKKIGELFYGMGFLATPEVVECSAGDLIGQYVGQTVPKTRKKLQECIGKVLFIDEACRFIYGPYANEAVDEIVQFLARSENEGKMIVILAGLSADIDRLLSTRPNIASHFPEEITFDHIPPKDCVELLARELKHKLHSSINIEAIYPTDPFSDNHSKLEELFRTMQATSYWSNARDVRNLSQRIVGKYIESTEEAKANRTRRLPFSLIIGCMKEMISQQKRLSTMPQPPHIGIDSLPALLNMQPTLPPFNSETGICAPGSENICSAMNHNISIKTNSQVGNHSSVSRVEAAHARMDAKGTMSMGLEDKHIREKGVPEATWKKLQKAKKDESAKHKQRKEESKKLQRDLQEAMSRGDSVKSASLQNRQLAIQRDVQREERVQEALAKMDRCVVGYVWIRQAGGYRCAGGSHYVSDAEVEMYLAT